MERIRTLGTTETVVTTALGFEFIQLPRFVTDEDRHDFVVDTLKPKESDKLIILLDSNNGYDGLKVGLHIRLTLSLHRARLIPLFFISSDSITVILRNAGIWGRILTTKGCKLGQLNVGAIQSGLEFPSLLPEEMSSFLSLIQLRPDEIAGRHSLANQWGAFALDKASGTRALRNNPSLLKARKQLYFKYIESTNYDFDKLNRPAITVIDLDKPKTERITAIGKKILLIDDEADKGWGDVLKKIFNTSHPESDFKIINRKINGWKELTSDEKKLILETGFDLYLIDLRLNGSDEENIAKPEMFSGADVMRQIKKHNTGNQIIMFTASNKAWNLKALLDFGADGYYIKESPEYNFSESFSNENLLNLKNEAELCLSYSFLKEVWAAHESMREWLQSDSVRQKYDPEQQKNIDQILAQLIIAYRLVNMREAQSVCYFVVTYVRILEILSEIFIVVDDETKSVTLVDGTKIAYCFWNKSLREYELQSFDVHTVKWNSYKSIANQTMALACQKLSFDVKTDKQHLRKVYNLIKSRNEFIHEGKEVGLSPATLTEWAKTMKKILRSL
ncbi:hypothetical protein JYG30_06235 [Fibrella sp. USSR17]